MSSNDPRALSDGKPSGSTDPQLNRACESCRVLKVRCLPNAASPSTQCQRCSKAGRACIFAAPQRKKPRKRTDARVAELEKEVRAMRSLLKGVKNIPLEDREEDTGRNGQPEKNSKDLTSDPGAFVSVSISGKQNADDGAPNVLSLYSETRYENHSDRISPVRVIGHSVVEQSDRDSQMEDVVDRGLLSLETANELVKIYVTELVQHLPVVVLPRETTAIDLRQSKPVLFLAVIAAAALSVDSELSYILYQEIIRAYADRIFVRCEKSLELIQSLLVTVGYCYPPDSAAQLQFYQYSHTAATMALDIGLGSKTWRSGPEIQTDLEPQQGPPSDGDRLNDGGLLENSRTLLTCYMMTAGLAMRLRRPNMLFFTNWMSESLSMLEESPALLDKRLAAHVNLQRIADEASTSFGFDDPSTSIRLTDSHMQVIIRGFERRMEVWRKANVPEIIDVSLDISYYQNFVTIYEFAIDGGHHDTEAFKHKYFSLPPLDEETVDISSRTPRFLSASQINATVKTVDKTKTLLDKFLDMDVKTLRMVPGVLYVRAVYSVVVLLKVLFAIGGSGLGEVMDSQSLRVDYYLEELSCRVGEAIGPKKLRVPCKWLPVIQRLQLWHTQHQMRFSKVEEEPYLQLQSAMDQLDSRGSMAKPVQKACDFGLVDRPTGFSSRSRMQESTDSTMPGSCNATTSATWSTPHDALLDKVQFAHSTLDTPPEGTKGSSTLDFPLEFGQDDLLYQDNLGGGLNGWLPEDFDSMNYAFTCDDLNLEPS